MIQWALVALLALNAVLVFAYRVFRLTQGGPTADVIGGAILAAILASLAIAISLQAEWARWAALLYGTGFGLVVMPVWTLAVLLPMRPRPVDYAFTVVYWATLLGIIATALAV